MNTQSIDCKFCATPEEFDAHGDGALMADQEVLDGLDDPAMFIYLMLPGGNDAGAIQVSRGAHQGRRIWQMTGNPRDMATFSLKPSILLKDEWHGFLTNGRLVSC